MSFQRVYHPFMRLVEFNNDFCVHCLIFTLRYQSIDQSRAPINQSMAPINQSIDEMCTVKHTFFQYSLCRHLWLHRPLIPVQRGRAGATFEWTFRPFWPISWGKQLPTDQTPRRLLLLRVGDCRIRGPITPSAAWVSAGHFIKTANTYVVRLTHFRLPASGFRLQDVSFFIFSLSKRILSVTEMGLDMIEAIK